MQQKVSKKWKKKSVYNNIGQLWASLNNKHVQPCQSLTNFRQFLPMLGKAEQDEAKLNKRKSASRKRYRSRIWLIPTQTRNTDKTQVKKV